jgi:hypothetical protein
MAPPPTITSIDIKKVRRGRWYPQIWIHGSYLPPVPAPMSYVRATHIGTGLYANFTDYLVYGPSLMYIWGTVPRHIPRGMYNLTYSSGGLDLTITNAFRVV